MEAPLKDLARFPFSRLSSSDWLASCKKSLSVSMLAVGGILLRPLVIGAEEEVSSPASSASDTWLPKTPRRALPVRFTKLFEFALEAKSDLLGDVGETTFAEPFGGCLRCSLGGATDIGAGCARVSNERRGTSQGPLGELLRVGVVEVKEQPLFWRI